MMILNQIYSTPELSKLIDICRSDSEILGTELRKAHYELGTMVGKMIRENHVTDNAFAVIIILRSGLDFGHGIADELDCPILFLDEKHDRRWKMNDYNNEFILEYKDILAESSLILVDAVINTGETIKQIYDTLSKTTTDIVIAANVIQDEFDNDKIPTYGTRKSSNKFKGCHILKQKGNQGPDTGDRLFRTLMDSKLSHIRYN